MNIFAVDEIIHYNRFFAITKTRYNKQFYWYRGTLLQRVPLYRNWSIKYVVQVLVASFAGKFACIHSAICPFKGWGKVTWVEGRK